MSYPDSILVELDALDAEALLRHLRYSRRLWDWPEVVERVYRRIDLELVQARRAGRREKASK